MNWAFKFDYFGHSSKIWRKAHGAEGERVTMAMGPENLLRLVDLIQRELNGNGLNVHLLRSPASFHGFDLLAEAQRDPIAPSSVDEPQNDHGGIGQLIVETQKGSRGPNSHRQLRSTKSNASRPPGGFERCHCMRLLMKVYKAVNVIEENPLHPLHVCRRTTSFV